MPKTKEYTVWGYDSFDEEDFLIGSYETLEEAKEVAESKSGPMKVTSVYKHGLMLAKYGTY